MSGDIEWDKTLNHLDQWVCRWDAPDCSLTIDNNEGANNSYCSLKYAASEVTNTWCVNLSYPSQNIKAGRYEFSYYVKTNQDDTPFTLSIVVCEDTDEIGWGLTGQKVIVVKSDGSQEISTAPTWDVACTSEYHAGKEWTKCSVTVDIPNNVLVRFVFKPCAYKGNGDPYDIWGKGTWGGVTYWFDDFALTPVE